MKGNRPMQEHTTAMSTECVETRIKGKNTLVPSIQISGRTIINTGKWMKTAAVRDEAFVEGEVVPTPETFICELRQWVAKPDMFSFAQKITDLTPRFSYFMEWDDFAVIPITSYEDWLKKQIKKDVKENLRRAKREGVVVRTSPYDDAFVQGIKNLYDETPIRQGKPFWHYGKSFDAIKEVHGTYCERSEYIGAYFEEELIGFIKMVYVDNFAKTMHVISKDKFHHKRPTNALIAKAVEVCAQKGISHFIYGEYNFPGKKQTSLTGFKRHNGFEEMKYPRYFIPLTAKGSMALRLGLHRGFHRHIPPPITNLFLKARSAYYRRKFPVQVASAPN